MMNAAEENRLLLGVIQEFERAYGAPLSSEKLNQVRSSVRELICQSDTDRKLADHRQVTILMSDLRGFTSLSEEVSPLEIVSMLNRYYEKMSEIIFSYNGVIDKFMGDGIMVLFGAPEKGSDDVLRAVACAIEMQIAMTEVNKVNQELDLPALFMGIGINTGDVFAGTVGSDLYREYTVIGNQVNLASRIEAHSLRGQILLSENSYKLAGEHIAIQGHNQVIVKGKAEPVDLYELQSTDYPKMLVVPRREIRNSHRVPVHMPITFQQVSNSVVSTNVFKGTIKDISYHGFLVSVAFEPELHSEWKFDISLSLLSGEVSSGYAKVLRVKKCDSEFECSIEITSLHESARMAIKSFVDSAIG